MIVVLVGLRGSGKTTVGRLVATELGWPFADTDALVEESAGQSIAAIFASEGEAGFRRRESAALAELLGDGPLVVATGGGAVLSEANRELMRPHFVVWLRADPKVLAARVAGDPRTAATRPALTGFPFEAELRELAARREELYRDVAAREVDAGRDSPRDVAGDILRFWDARRG